MERIEKEMRVQLHLKRLEVRVRELRFELQGAFAAFAIASVVIVGITRQGDQHVDAHPLTEIGDYEPAHACKREWFARAVAPIQPKQDVAERSEEHAEQNTNRQVQQ